MNKRAAAGIAIMIKAKLKKRHSYVFVNSSTKNINCKEGV